MAWPNRLSQITRLLVTFNSQLSGWKNRFSIFPTGKTILYDEHFLVSLEICGCKDLHVVLPTPNPLPPKKEKKTTFLCVCTCGSQRTSRSKWFPSSTRWVPEVELSCQASLSFMPLSHIAGPPQGLAQCSLTIDHS